MSTMNKSYKVSNGDSVLEGFDEDDTDDDVFDICGTQLVKCFVFIPTIPTVIIIPYFVTGIRCYSFVFFVTCILQ